MMDFQHWFEVAVAAIGVFYWWNMNRLENRITSVDDRCVRREEYTRSLDKFENTMRDVGNSIANVENKLDNKFEKIHELLASKMDK